MMLEEDYRQLAIKRANTDVETNHWNYVLDNKIWVSKDNTETPFKQLDTAHLQHIAKGLLDFKHPLCAEIAKEIIDIIAERAIENNKKALKRKVLEQKEVEEDESMSI